MNIHPKVTQERVMAAVRRNHACNENCGFCTACGGEAEDVEPDAHDYKCEGCGESAVYGAEELLIYLVGG